MIAALFLLLGPPLILALPPAAKEKSWSKFLLAFVLSTIGLWLLLVFLASIGLTPEWKGACAFGWIDCFHLGKLALTPLVIWAVAAYYANDIFGVTGPAPQWIVLGYFQGAIVSSVCLIHGLFCHGGRNDSGMWLMVPMGVAGWFLIRSFSLHDNARVKGATYVLSFCWSLPFWALSVFWSYQRYLSLPDQQPPGCFVVTAAARGHRQFVGPFVPVTRRGRRQWANQQLLTLWAFEALWRARLPRLHAGFRFFYNRLGPIVARNIRSPWLADAVYLALKPAELIAAVTVRVAACIRYSPLTKVAL